MNSGTTRDDRGLELNVGAQLPTRADMKQGRLRKISKKNSVDRQRITHYKTK